MSANTSLRPGQGTRPLMVLAALLENAQHRDDKIVSFPANTSDAIIQARPRGKKYDMHEVHAIVLALESRDSTICERLDSLSLIILCSIFLYSQECRAQQRGLCLLARVLHRTERDTPQEVVQKQAKKTTIGRAALTQMIKGFLKTDNSEKLRRWLGILSLELLKDCPENVGKLQSDPPEERHWRYLGEVIEHGSCQVLKLLAGSMIRELLSLGVLPDDFWPSKTSSDLFSKFPKGQCHNSQWVTSFEEYVDELVLQKILTQEVSSVLFAYAVYVGDRQWNLKQALDILVTVSEELNIVIPANDTSPAVYVDVLLDSISEVSFDHALIPDSQQPTYGVVMSLDAGVTTNCILNATGSVESHLAVAFSSQKDASTLKRLLMPTDFQTHGLAPHSRLGTSDASEQILPDHELAAPDPAISNNRILTGPTALDNAFDFDGTINPSMLERVYPTQRALIEHQENSSDLVVEGDKDRVIVGHHVDMAVEGIDVSNNDVLIEEAIEGIDVSQFEGSSHESIQRRDNQADIPGNVSSNTRLQNHSRVPDNQPLSSSHLNTDHNATENVPPFHVQPTQQVVCPVEKFENKSGAEGQDREHNDLYYASPKITKGHRRSPRVLEQDNTSENLERPLKPAATQGSAKKDPPVKLSRQLRNADGVVEVHTEQTADDGLTELTKDKAVDITTSANKKKNRVVPAPGKETKGLKGLTERGKKTAPSKREKGAAEGARYASLDEYDLPPSPKRVSPSIKHSGDENKAPSSRPKATKAPRDNKKKAKPLPTKAPAAASLDGSVPQLSNGLKNVAEESDPPQEALPNVKSVKKVDDDDDDAIWDVDHAHGTGEIQSFRPSRQPLKPAKRQDVRIPKSEKNRIQAQLHSNKAKANKPPNTHNREASGRLVGARPAPIMLSRTRPRRTAAVKANKKIQGLDESDDIMDDEDLAAAPTLSKQHIPLVEAKPSKDQKVTNGGDDRRAKISTEIPPAKDFIPDSVSPDFSDDRRRDSVLDRKAGSSGEKVNLIKYASAKALRAGGGDKANSLQGESPTSAAHASGRDGHITQPDRISAAQGGESSEARACLVPNRPPQLREPTSETVPAHTSFQTHKDAKQRRNDLEATSGPGDQDQVDHVVPCTDDEPCEPKLSLDRTDEKVSRPQAPTAPMTVSIREKRNSPRLAGSAEKSLLKPSPTRRDPFVSKLSASMPQEKYINHQIKSSKVSRDNGLESKEQKTSIPNRPEESLRQFQTKALKTLGAASSDNGGPNESIRKFLRSSMQLDSQGKSSIKQSLRPDGEEAPASGLEMKRRIEQEGESSKKRAKVVSKQQLAGARRKRGFDAEKTPPPVVSNKPLVIGFSASGPRNQGTLSTRKSRTPKNVGIRALASRKHKAPKAMIDEVDVDMTSIQESPEEISKGIQSSARIPSVAQKKEYDPSRRKRAEHSETVNAFAAVEAQTQEKAAEKRKLALFNDDPALSKRQKRDMRTPPPAQKDHAKMLPDVGPALCHDRSQRLSSQNTRVNENGSPMPFFVDRNESTRAKDQYSDDDDDDGKDALAEARLEEHFMVRDDDDVLPAPTLPPPPLVSAVSASQSKARAYQNLSNNSKQVPSSPHASSAFGTMPPHHLYHDGEIVNAETKEPIISSKPQDPFLDPILSTTQKPSNAFMDALRRASELAAKSLISVASDKGNSRGVVMHQDVIGGEDPDKTLVEPNLRKRHIPVHVSDRSSTSQSDSSTQTSRPNEPSEEDSEAGMEAKWRQGLEPYQENMLDCLLTISHRLIRHLIDKETAIEDMVRDFASHGNGLVNRYEKALRERIDSHEAYNDRKRQNLAKIFEKAKADVATTSKSVSKRHVQNMQAQWKAHQEALMGKVTAALEACAE